MDDWTYEQLAAAVEAYRWMQQRIASGLAVNKAQVYRDLASRHGRTPKAWEYRMQNISHVLDQSDQRWIEGLRPAKNVGPEVTGTLVRHLGDGTPSAVSPATLAQLEEQHQLLENSGFFLPENVEDQRNRAIRSIVQRRGQREFRVALMAAYQNSCAMTGCAVVDVLEAAHIHSYMGSQTNLVSNGLLLRADVHTLFDLHLVSVDVATMTICVAPQLLDTTYRDLMGRALAAPSAKHHAVDRRQLEKHRAHCNW